MSETSSVVLALAYLVAWLAWFLAWILSARGLAKNVHAAPGRQQLNYRVLQVGGLVLLIFSANGHYLPDLTLWQSLVLDWLFYALLIAGLGFSYWGRAHLGSMWSSAVTIKKDHALIRSGPYGIVRHPIYTGLLIGLWASALAVGRLWALIGVAVFTVGLVLKAQLEEAVLSDQFATGEYEAYRREMPMLVPFWPMKG